MDPPLLTACVVSCRSYRRSTILQEKPNRSSRPQQHKHKHILTERRLYPGSTTSRRCSAPFLNSVHSQAHRSRLNEGQLHSIFTICEKDHRRRVLGPIIVHSVVVQADIGLRELVEGSTMSRGAVEDVVVAGSCGCAVAAAQVQVVVSKRSTKCEYSCIEREEQG